MIFGILRDTGNGRNRVIICTPIEANSIVNDGHNTFA